MDKISIIIPVYNVEPYIRKSLDSVTNQTYTNLEIICVNDGSTDNSGRICDEYAVRDKRIRVFHRNNGGVSSAKNIGLKHMTGEYVGFVDSDDWIEPNMYEVLYRAINDNDVHISVGGYFKDTDKKSTPMKNKKKISDGVIPTREMLLYPLQRDYYMGFCGYMCNKLFSADIFKSNNLRFDESIKYGEDVLLYTRMVLSKKCTGVYVDKPLYHYLQHDTMATKTKSLNFRTDILTVYKSAEALLNDNGYSDISFWVRGFYCHHASVIAEIAMAKHDVETLRFMQAEMRLHLDDYIKTNKEFTDKIHRMYKLLSIS